MRCGIERSWDHRWQCVGLRDSRPSVQSLQPGSWTLRDLDNTLKQMQAMIHVHPTVCWLKERGLSYLEYVAVLAFRHEKSKQAKELANSTHSHASVTYRY